MSRPVKPRRITFMPKSSYFVPAGKAKCEIEEIILKLEELEAMRLKDIEHLSQEECAGKMHVSRQTFQLIIDDARIKVAEALTMGKAIRIQGGNYTFNICKHKCIKCGIDFNRTYETETCSCPKCGSDDLICNEKGKFCKKMCNKYIENE